MVEYGVVKVEKDGAEAEEIASAWRENLRALEKTHPRVFRKVMKEVLDYTGEDELGRALLKLARELMERHKKNQRLQSVKIAITYTKYNYFHHGSLVKLFLDGTVSYNPRSTVEGYGFVIHNGEEV